MMSTSTVSTPPQVPPSPSARVARGLAAFAALLVLVVGIPAGLWFFGGTIVAGPVSWDLVVSTLSTPDVTGTVLLGLVKTVGWLAWLTFATAVLIEVVAAVRGVRSPRVAGLGVQQRAAAALVGAVVLMFLSAPGAGPAFAAPATTGGPTAELTSVSTLTGAGEATIAGVGEGTATIGGDVARQGAVPTSAPAPATYTVKPGDSLWRIAAATLGDGTRFKEIASLNYGVPQAGGGSLDGSHWIEPGWVLTLPDGVQGVAADVAGASTADAANAGAETAGSPPPARTVQAGDTLWEIAEEELGDGTRYPELYDASRNIVQPDGAQLTDPDLIRPGWTVSVPSAEATVAAAAGASAVTPAPAPAPAPELAPAPEPAPAPAEAAPEAPGRDAGHAVDDAVDEAVEGAAAPDAATPEPVAEADLSSLEVAESAPAEQAAPAERAAPGAPDAPRAAPYPDASVFGEREALDVPGPRAADVPQEPTYQAVTPDELAADDAPLDQVNPWADLVPEGSAEAVVPDGAGDGATAPQPADPASEGAGDGDVSNGAVSNGAVNNGDAGRAAGGLADATSPAEAVSPADAVAPADAVVPEGAVVPDGAVTPEGAVTPDRAVGDAVVSEAPLEAAPAEPSTVEGGAPAGSDVVGQEELDAAETAIESSPPVAAPAPLGGATADAAEVEATDPLVAAALVDADLGDELEELVDIRTAAGVGGLLAAGVLALVAARRAEARRRRRAGERIALPPAGSAVADLEQQLRAVQDPFGREQVDRALRGLARWHRERGLALPGVRVARLKSGEFLELYLDRPAALPQPWISTADRYVWQLVAGDVDELVAEAGDDAPSDAPYPSLVTVGHDDENTHLLLDLENIACLDIRGTDESAQSTLAALAIELATSLWADDLQVTVVGALGDLPGVVDTGRVRHVPSLAGIVRELEARAADVERTLAQVGASSVADARGRGLAMDAWTPEILLVGERLGTAERTALEAMVERVPGVGIAAVTSSADIGEWVLDLTGELTGGDTGRGVLMPAFIALRPQQLDAQTYARALELLGEPESVPGPEWARHVVVEETQIADIQVQAVPVGATARRTAGGLDLTERPTALPLALAEGPEPERAPVGGPLVPTGPADVSPAVVGSVPAAPGSDFDPLAEPVEPRPARTPVVRVLGPVELAGVQGTPLPASHQRQALELVAYLAFNPGARGSDISRALWPSREPNLATRRSAVSRARRWMGVDAYGYEHLPRYWSSDDGSQVDQESAGYRLRGVTTDWDQFCELVGPDLAATSMEDLLSALALVRGRPFEDAPARKYVWAETLLQEITAGVVDVAHEVARRALVSGEVALARDASRVGRLVDPVDERSWRNGIRAEWAGGRVDAVGRLVTRLRDHLEQLELDPEPETEELISEMHALAGRRRAQ